MRYDEWRLVWTEELDVCPSRTSRNAAALAASPTLLFKL